MELIRTNSITCIGNYPEGQIMEHGPAEGIDERTAKERFSSEEKRALDRMQQDIYQEIRHAAEAHRQVCYYPLSQTILWKILIILHFSFLSVLLICVGIWLMYLINYLSSWWVCCGKRLLEESLPLANIYYHNEIILTPEVKPLNEISQLLVLEYSLFKIIIK